MSRPAPDLAVVQRAVSEAGSIRGAARKLGRADSTLRGVLRRAGIEVEPATHVPSLAKPKPLRRCKSEPWVAVIESDHQAPYFQPELDAAQTAMVADLQPRIHVFAGDLMDLPTISRHADHPAAQATPQECVDAAYHILRRRAEAAPNAQRLKLKGNHDWRIEGEQLVRAERMYGLHPADDPEPALSVRRLLHLDALGVELVEDPRGWQHAEVELVPGINGLVVRHGWLTGHNTAARTLAKRGRSIIVGHGHNREHAFQWDPSACVERQAAMTGTMSLARNERFPHFAPLDKWLQGSMVVSVWPDGNWIMEHARWHDGHLYWRDRRW